MNLSFAPPSVRRAIVCALMLAASACAASAPPSVTKSDGRLIAALTAPTRPAGPGTHSIRAGADATLYIPASAGDAPAPFLILLHGAGGGAEGMIRRFRAEADRRGIILFCAANPPERHGMPSPRSARGRPPAFGEDVARIDTALAEAFTRVSADPKRLGIAGFSDGAGYALSLGVRNSDRFSGIFGFSPGMIVSGDIGPRSRVFISHGERDRVLAHRHFPRARAPA